MSSSKQGLRTLAFLVSSILLLPTLLAAANTSVVSAELKTQYVSSSSTNRFVDLTYLAKRPEEFENQSVTTIGTVRFYASIYMFEDFWLQAPNDEKIPVVTRFVGLSVPTNYSSIEISGTIKHSTLEGGFYFLNASSWTTIVTVPEFQTGISTIGILIVVAVLLIFTKSETRLSSTSKKRTWK